MSAARCVRVDRGAGVCVQGAVGRRGVLCWRAVLVWRCVHPNSQSAGLSCTACFTYVRHTVYVSANQPRHVCVPPPPRFDLTWGPIEYHRRSLDNLQAAMRKSRKLCAIVLDTLGREVSGGGGGRRLEMAGLGWLKRECVARACDSCPPWRHAPTSPARPQHTTPAPPGHDSAPVPHRG
jgi:hypothetical protein